MAARASNGAGDQIPMSNLQMRQSPHWVGFVVELVDRGDLNPVLCAYLLIKTVNAAEMLLKLLIFHLQAGGF